MTSRSGTARGWLRRVGGAAVAAPVLLVMWAPAVWAVPADGSGRLGQTPPALSWIQLTDSRGIPIWNYELSLDRGGITSPDKFFWSALTDSCWGAYRSWCALALWFLDWVLSFDWLHIVAAPVLTTGDAMQSVVNRIGAAGALLTITAVVAVVWMMRGRWATGIWELSIALVIAALASGVFASPVRMLAGENGVIAQSQQWGLQLSAALADGGGSGGQSADQLRKAQAGQLVDTFIRIPTQMINFGQVLDGGKCESAYTEVVKAGPYGPDSKIRDKINGCDPVLGKYAASPSASMAMGSLLFMPASVVILLLAIVLSGSVIAAGCSAMYQGLKAIVTLVTGLLPGGGRGSLLLTAAEAVMALAIILFTTVFLGIFLQVIQAVFKSGAGDAVPKTFVIVDVLLLVGVFIYRRQRQRFKEAAARMAEWMAKRPGQGVRPTRLPAQQHGAGLGSTAAGVARSAVSLAQLRAMRASARNTGNTYNLDARRQAVIVEGHPGGGGGGGPVDIGPGDTGPPPTGPGGRPGGGPQWPLGGPSGGLKRIAARKNTVVGTLVQAGTSTALAAATGGGSAAATGAARVATAGKSANTARQLTRAAVQARLALPPGPSASPPPRGSIALPGPRPNPVGGDAPPAMPTSRTGHRTPATSSPSGGQDGPPSEPRSTPAAPLERSASPTGAVNARRPRTPRPSRPGPAQGR